MEFGLLKLKILNCRSVMLEKEEHFQYILFGVFEILEHSFLSQHFRKSIFSGDISLVVDCKI